MLRKLLLTNSRIVRKLCVVACLALAGVAVLAYDSTVNVEVRWRVLPYQSLTLIGPSSDPSLVSVRFPAPTDGDRARGYMESESALRLHVASNVAWKVQLRSVDNGASVIEARQRGSEYAALSTQPLVLAAGPYGVYDLDLDLRRPLVSGEAVDGVTAVQLIATIMPE